MRLHTSILCLLLAPLGAAAGQSAADAAAFVALDATPVGALTPLLTPSMVARRLNGAQLGIRYGFSSDNNVSRHVIAGSALFGMGTNSSVTLTAGVGDEDCNGCETNLLLGIGGDMRIFESGDPLGPGTSFNLGVSGDFGYGQVKSIDGSAISIGVGAPMALTVSGGGTTGMRIVPYFTPVFGIGQLNVDCLTVGCDKSGTRFVLGGGIGLWNPMTSVSASLGFNKVMFQGSPTTFGVNVLFGGR